MKTKHLPLLVLLATTAIIPATARPQTTTACEDNAQVGCQLARSRDQGMSLGEALKVAHQFNVSPDMDKLVRFVYDNSDTPAPALCAQMMRACHGKGN